MAGAERRLYGAQGTPQSRGPSFEDITLAQKVLMLDQQGQAEAFDRLLERVQAYEDAADAREREYAALEVEREKLRIEQETSIRDAIVKLQDAQGENARAILAETQKNLRKASENMTQLATASSAGFRHIVDEAIVASQKAGGGQEGAVAGWLTAVGGLQEAGLVRGDQVASALPGLMLELESELGLAPEEIPAESQYGTIRDRALAYKQRAEIAKQNLGLGTASAGSIEEIGARLDAGTMDLDTAIASLQAEKQKIAGSSLAETSPSAEELLKRSEGYQAALKRMEAMVENEPSERGSALLGIPPDEHKQKRDLVAKIIMQPAFREWADARGLHLGSAVIDDEGNVVSYAAAKDDARAVLAANHEAQWGTTKEGLPYIPRRARHRLRTDKMVKVSVPQEERHRLQFPDGRYAYVVDARGDQVYQTPEQVAAILKAQGLAQPEEALSLLWTEDGPVLRGPGEEEGEFAYYTLTATGTTESGEPTGVAWSPTDTAPSKAEGWEPVGVYDDEGITRYATVEDIGGLDPMSLGTIEEPDAQAIRSQSTVLNFTDELPPNATVVGRLLKPPARGAGRVFVEVHPGKSGVLSVETAPGVTVEEVGKAPKGRFVDVVSRVFKRQPTEMPQLEGVQLTPGAVQEGLPGGGTHVSPGVIRGGAVRPGEAGVVDRLRAQRLGYEHRPSDWVETAPDLPEPEPPAGSGKMSESIVPGAAGMPGRSQEEFRTDVAELAERLRKRREVRERGLMAAPKELP